MLKAPVTDKGPPEGQTLSEHEKMGCSRLTVIFAMYRLWFSYQFTTKVDYLKQILSDNNYH